MSTRGPALLLLAACSGKDELASPETGTTTTETGSGTSMLQGKVWTPDGAAVRDAVVSVGTKTTSTNALGFFTLQDLPSGEAVITVEAEGYSTSGAVRDLVDDQWSYVDLRVAPAEVLVWDPATGGALETSSGVRIGLGALVDALGEEVTPPVNVAVTLLDEAGEFSAAPGELMADRDGQDVLLESLGMAEVRLTDDAGDAVQLGEPATLSFPVADLPVTDGFELFGYDPSSGRWQEEGGGTVEDGRFEAQVPHFSWWNCDIFVNTDQCVTGTLVAGSDPLASASISVKLYGSYAWGNFRTEPDGSFVIGLPPGVEVQLELSYGAFTWESDTIVLPDEEVRESDRPGGCVDLGEMTAHSTDDDRDEFVGAAYGGPDCDDDDPAIHPLADDPSYDGIDEDCGGEDDYDADQDGYVPEADVGLPTQYVEGSGGLPGDDCDDSDYWTNPGRVDYCNGEDDNCSGDESDAVDQQTWYQDEDGDGYGTDASATTACDSPAGPYVTQGGDCDDGETAPCRYYPGAPEDCGADEDYNCDGHVASEDSDGDGFIACEDCDDGDASASPGVAEVCDEVDNDCDGATDEDVTLTYARDYDLDGYGDPATETTGCAVPDGYTLTGDAGRDDCDDSDPDRYPGAPEICEDGVLQDCEETEADAIDACTWSGTTDLSAASAILVGSLVRGEAGDSVSGAGDVNGDGLDDLLIGAPLSSPVMTQTGAVYLVLGPVSGEVDLSAAGATLRGDTESGMVGTSIDLVGDADGDGLADMLLGSPGYNATGRAYLVLGPVSGAVDLADADAIFDGEAINDTAVQRVSSAGDMDGDGRVDLLIGADSRDPGGVAYLVLAPFGGEMSLADADVQILGEEADDGAGSALALAGDVDGDGLPDLLVGAIRNDATGTNAGAAYLVLGPVTGDLDLADADARLIGEEARDTAGRSVSSAGDVDGDGQPDLLTGAMNNGAGGTYAGAAYLVLAPVSGEVDLSTANAKFIGEEANDGAGKDVSDAGDVDGDDHADLLIGAYRNGAAGTNAGAAYLVLGPVSGEVDLSAADAKFVGEEAQDLAGDGISAAGDVNGDGRSDLIIGASHSTRGAEYGGAAYLLLNAVY